MKVNGSRRSHWVRNGVKNISPCPPSSCHCPLNVFRNKAAKLIMHPQARLADEVGMKLLDLEVVNRLRLVLLRDGRNRQRRPGASDDTVAVGQQSATDSAPAAWVSRLRLRNVINRLTGKFIHFFR